MNIIHWGEQTPNYFSPNTTPQGSFLSFNYGTAKYGVYNPVAMANSGYWKIKNERILPKFNIQYQIIPEVLRYQADLATYFWWIPETATWGCAK